MVTKLAQHTPEPVAPAEVHEVLDKILGSKYFVNAHKKKAFLRLICDLYLEGRAAEVNEYRIAFDVFGREETYNPSADPIVRVVAHDIRKKLELYYQGEGAVDPIRLEIPAGSYQPIFTRAEPAPAEPAESAATTADAVPHGAADEPSPIEAAPAPQSRRRSFGVIALSAAVVVLAIAVVALALSNRELRQRAGGPAAEAQLHGLLWAPFAEDETPPLVILSNPPTLRLANATDPEASAKDAIPLAPEAVEALKDKFVLNPEIMVRESSGSAPSDSRGSQGTVVLKQNRVPRLIYGRNVYTGMGEAIGLHYLTDFFRTANRGILVKQSRTLSAEDVKNHNVILLGGVWVNEWAGKLTEDEDFVFTSNGTISNRSPQPGEEREYIPQFDGRTANLLVDYALITVKPNLSDANKVMVLAGVYSQGTEAAAEYVTNKNYVDQLNQRLQQLREADGPAGDFQVLLKVGVENGIPTTISIVAIHKLTHAEPR
jgi:hypothetical protein